MIDALDRIIKARSDLIIAQPFFGVLALRLKLVETKSVPTMATDGSRLLYNPDFVLKLTLDELKGVICHEVLHCSNGHPWRKGLREHLKWNVACDYAINPIVVEDGSLALPKDALLDKQFAGQPAEQIYSTLPEVKKGQGCGFGEVLGAGEGAEFDNDADGEAVGETSQDDWKVATVQAAQQAKMRGKLPAHLERLVGEFTNPKIDWKAALQNIVQQALAKDDYSWRMPNQRYIAGGYYMPSLRSEKIPPIVVAVDTSGSIGAKELAEFAAEINAISSQCRPEIVYVVYCDAAINRTEEYNPGDDIQLRPIGGGGTDFRPVFSHVAKSGIEPACLIYLTDMYGAFPEDAPGYPVVWAATTDQQGPFGITLDIR